MYCIAKGGSQYLVNLTNEGPTYSHLASDVLTSRFAWISSTRAAQALKDAIFCCPDEPLGLALLELEASGPGLWRVASTKAYAAFDPTTPLVS